MNSHKVVLSHSFIIEAVVLLYEFIGGTRQVEASMDWLRDYEPSIVKLKKIYDKDKVRNALLELPLISKERTEVERFKEEVMSGIDIDNDLSAELVELVASIVNSVDFKACFDEVSQNDCDQILSKTGTELIDCHPLSYAQSLMGKSFYNIKDWQIYEFCPVVMRSEKVFRLWNDESNIMVLPVYVSASQFEKEEMELKRLMKLMADESRLKILRLIYSNPMNGKSIAEQLGIKKATVSHHMDILRTEGFLHIERSGNSKLYSTNQKTYSDFIRRLNRYVTNT